MSVIGTVAFVVVYFMCKELAECVKYGKTANIYGVFMDGMGDILLVLLLLEVLNV